jgi:cytochrome P450
MDALEIFTALGTPAGKANPYPHYAALHELGEVVTIAPGVVAAVGYDANNAVLRDPGFRCQDSEVFEHDLPGWREHPALVQGADWILNLNGDKHARIRSLIARAFTARRVAGLEPAVTKMADELIDAMAESGSGGRTVEFMHDFAYLLPITVICELIGIPEQDRESFRPIARALAQVFEFDDLAALPAIDAAAVELLAYFTGLAAKRRAEPRDDLISALLAISDSDDGRLTDAELLHNLTLLLVAGFETTTNLLGNGLQVILHDPAARAALRDGAVGAAAFVTEVLRFDSPVQLTSRLGYETKVAGVPIADGDRVVTILGAGNRDPRRFADPDVFDPTRPDGAPLSFGGGAHFCIGAALARMEGAIAFPRLLARFPEIAAAGEPARRDGLLLRGFDAMPVTVQ